MANRKRVKRKSSGSGGGISGAFSTLVLLFLAISLISHFAGVTKNDTPSAPATSATASEGSSQPQPSPALAKSDVLGISSWNGATAVAPGTARSILDTLAVAPHATNKKYDRDKFGRAWTDKNSVAGGNNGCDTRNDILARDLNVTSVDEDQCKILTGVLVDAYTETTINFTRGISTSDEVQIDHIHSLSAAHRTGAAEWDDAKRVNFANDPLNLVAVDGPTNSSKSDSDASQWLPPSKSAHCVYVARQIAVKYKYQLWVTTDEKSAMIKVLDTCPGQELPA